MWGCRLCRITLLHFDCLWIWYDLFVSWMVKLVVLPYFHSTSSWYTHLQLLDFRRASDCCYLFSVHVFSSLHGSCLTFARYKLLLSPWLLVQPMTRTHWPHVSTSLLCQWSSLMLPPMTCQLYFPLNLVLWPSVLWHCWFGWPVKNLGGCGGGGTVSPIGVAPARTVGASVSIIFPCSIKSRR